MGYGKTMSMLDYLDHYQLPYLWLCIERNETSPRFIWDTFCRQIAKDNERLAKQLLAIGFPFTTPQRNIVLQLLEKAITDNPFIIIVDDYHYSKSDDVDEFIYYLAKYMPDRIRLYVLTRIKPKIGIEELLLKGYCHVISESDYQLTLTETATMFKMNRVLVSSDIIRDVFELSEGWISAVSLLISHYKNTGTINGITHIEQLIETAVLPDYTAEELELLVSLSILKHFTIDQISQIFFRQGIEEVLKRVIYNSFIRYNSKDDTYTIHNILRNHLTKYHFTYFSEEKRYNLYRGYGLWYSQKNDSIEAIRNFMKIKDYPMVLLEFEKPQITRLFYFYPEYVYQIFDEIPREITYQYPLAYLCFLHYLITTKDHIKGMALIKELEVYNKESRGYSQIEKDKLQGEIEHVLSLAEFNDCKKMLSRQKKAYQLLGGKAQLARKEKVASMGSYSILYLYYSRAGDLKKITEEIYNNFRYYEYVADGAGRGLDEVAMAEYLFHTGDIEKAYIHAMKARYKAKETPVLDILVCANFILARIAIVNGNIDEAKAYIESINNYKIFESNTSYYTSIYKPYTHTKDWIYMILGEIENVSDILINEPLNRNALFYQSIGTNYIVYGKYLLARKAYIELEMHCKDTLEILKTYNNILGYIHTYVLLAIAQLYICSKEDAVVAINEAFRLAKCDGVCTLFYEYGETLLLLIDELGLDSEFAVNVYEGTKRYVETIQLGQERKKSTHLTRREKEILSLVSKGMSNSEVAKELFISESAVKKTLSSCYRKLGVKNRGMAIKAYEWDIK